MSDTNDKLTALAGFLEGALNAQKPGVNVETRYRRASETGRNRGDQREVLGDPVYYLEVLPAATSPEQRDPSIATVRRTHTFQVVFMFEYEDGATRAGSSQPEYNDLFDALYTAAGQGYLDTSAGPQIMRESDADHQFTALDSRGEVIVHEATFDVTLEDQNQQ
jgi:hypothetical protein